jgi:D-alanine-D-alanine ligase
MVILRKVLGGEMIGVAFGGDSLEHEVSIESAKDVMVALDAKSLYLRKDGIWEVDGKETIDILPILKSLEMVVPMFHGSCGEDGSFQGFLQMHNIAFVGSDHSSSALCMDKDFTKRILMTHDIAVTPFQTIYSLEQAQWTKLDLPCVIKAAKLGSSIGVYKVYKNPSQYFEKAFALCDKVLVEEMVEGREVWVSVLEREGALIFSDPCEIIPKGDVFTYENKYLEEDGAVYHVPAQNVDKQEIWSICNKVFKVLGCKGMARIDLFVKDSGEVLVNEVNTIPGFRRKSLYPKALIAKGVSYKEILQSLMGLVRC